MMDWNLVYWVGVFLIEAGLLGMIMFTLICLFDLENDFINPHDATGRLNKLLMPERFFQVAHTALLLFKGEWWLTLPNAVVLAWLGWQMVRQESLMDVTEIFNQLPREKRIRLLKLAIHLVLFLAVIYRLVEAAVAVLMNNHGHTITKTLMTNVVASTSGARML